MTSEQLKREERAYIWGYEDRGRGLAVGFLLSSLSGAIMGAIAVLVVQWLW